MANFGALSSLGIGSGVLNYDVIDKLKKADEKIMLQPIDSKLQRIEKQKSALDDISLRTATLKSAIVDMANGVLFAKRSISVTGESVRASVQDGVMPQEFTIQVNQLAARDIYQSKGFSGSDAVVTNVDTTMSIAIGDQTYDLNVEAGTTLEELQTMINDQTEGKVVASLLDTGGTDPMRLIVKSSETGADQAITFAFDDGDSGTSDDDFLSITDSANHLQTAVDAAFIFNGVNVTRSQNSIDDLVTGVSLELLKVDSDTPDTSGPKSIVKVTQDAEGIADSMEAFVQAYNSWRTEIGAATKYDEETKTVGLFQGEGTIMRLMQQINQSLVSVDAQGRGLASYGIELNKEGVLSFKRSVFIDALKADPDSVEKALVGTDGSPGAFKRMNETLQKATDPLKGSLSTFETQLSDEKKRLSSERQRTAQFLEDRYSIMAQRFAAFDEQIAKLNASFQSLQMQIEAQLRGK